MSVPIRIRRRQSGSAGAPGVLRSSELAFSEVDGILYYGKGADAQGNASEILGIGGNASKNYADGIVATERDARIAADNDLNSAIDAEETRALAAEAALGTRIDNVLSNVTPGSLDSLSEVVTAFQAADSNLNGAITSLASSASTGLQNEITRATAAEAGLASDISDIETAATALSGRVTTAEGDIDALESRAGNIESAATTLAGRVTSAESAATALSGRVSTAESDIDSIESAATSLTNRVTTAESDIDSVEARILLLETEIDGGTF